jgi:hypothetical protein
MQSPEKDGCHEASYSAEAVRTLSLLLMAACGAAPTATSRGGAHGFSHGSTIGYADCYTNSNYDVHANADCDCNDNSDCDRNAHTCAELHTHANEHPDGDSHQHAYQGAYSRTYKDTSAHSMAALQDNLCDQNRRHPEVVDASASRMGWDRDVQCPDCRHILAP